MDVRQFAFLARQTSARIQPREQFCGLPKRALALLLANVMFWQPLWAQAEGIVVSGSGTNLQQAGNGVPIVNIATPNATGLSHNQYKDYNVGSQGVILNNATGRTQNTQLGGIIVGNPNLAGSAANVILNEVTGGNPSQLRGYTEVAGQSAKVIVANPYGMTCNGCGFINTPQVTLTTGKPIVENGRVQRYQVDGGAISIDGQGLNASNVDGFEIITRSAQINAQINARNLAIVAGRNDVDAATLQATARADDGSAKPQLAIDSSALGGMYAGSIKLVGTEAGVGVKLAGHLAASAGDIQLDANGHLSLAQAAASGAVNVTAQSLDAQGPVYAGSQLQAQTRGNLTISNNLAARDSITLSSGGQLTNSGIIEAGVNADNSRNAHGDVHLKAQAFSNRNSVVASRNLKVVSAGAIDNRNGSLSGANLEARADHLDNRSGQIRATESATVTAKDLDNRQGRITSQNQLSVNAVTGDNRTGTLHGDRSLQLAVDHLDNQQGLLSGRGTVDITSSGLFDNRVGTVIGDSLLRVQAGAIDNREGEIVGQQDVEVRTEGLDNQNGKLIAQGALLLAGAHLDNRQNGLVAATQSLNVHVDTLDNRGGELSSEADIELSGGQLDNDDAGQVLARGSLILAYANVLNRAKGLLSGKAGIDLRADSLDNSGGRLLSQRNIDLLLTGAALNQKGLISSEGGLLLRVGSLDNTGGKLSSAGLLTLDSRGLILNRGGELVTDQGLTLSSASLDNSQGGRISGKGAVKLTTGAFNNEGGDVSSANTLDLNAQQVSNLGGRIGSQFALTATLQGLATRAGQFFSNSALTLDLNGGDLDNRQGLLNAPELTLRNVGAVYNQGGEISSGQAFTLKARSLDNSAGKLLSNQTLTLHIEQALANLKGQIAAAALSVQTGSLDNSEGVLTSRSDLNLTSQGSLLNRNNGLINAATVLDIHSADLDNQGGQLLGNRAVRLDLNGGTLNNSAGLINGEGPLTFNRIGAVDNRNGEISSNQSYTLTSAQLDNRAGKVISSGQLSVISGAIINRNGLLSGWQGVNLQGSSLDNRDNGTVSSRDGNMAVDLSGALLNSNAGALASAGRLDIDSARLDNSQGGILSSGAGQSLTVQDTLDNSEGGLIDSGAELTVRATDLSNRAGTVNSQQGLSFTGTQLDNTSGQWASNGSITLDLLGTLINAQGKFASGGPLRIQRAAHIDNQGGQLVSKSLLSLLTGSLDNRNRGTLAALDQLTVDASGTVQNGADGLIYSQNGAVSLSAAELKNGGGAVQSQTGLTLHIRGAINNANGRLIAQNGDLLLNAGSLDNRGGILSSLRGALEARMAGSLLNAQGTLQGQRLTLLALAGLDNQNGRIAAQSGDASITTADLNNSAGGLYAKGLIDVNADTLTNAGQIAGGRVRFALGGTLINRSGIIESDSFFEITAANLDNQGGSLRALGTDGASVYRVGGVLDNQSGVIEIANADLTVDAGSFHNTNGSLLHVGLGEFNISSANVTAAGGSLVTRGGLTLNADSWTNSGVLQAGRLTIKVGNFHQTASGQLLASQSLRGEGVNWSNDGKLASDGDLWLGLSGTYAGNGRVTSLGNLQIDAAQLQLAAPASITSGAGLKLDVGGTLLNRGRITSVDDAGITAGNIDNYGTVGSARSLTLKTGALLNERGLLFSGGDMGLQVDTFTNRYADVYSLANLRIDRDGSGGHASLIRNSSSTLQSDGSMSLAASTIENVREVLTVNDAGIYTGKIYQVACIEGVNAGDCSGKRNFVFEVLERQKLEVTQASQASSITAGGNLSFNGGDLLNQSSTIATGGNLNASVTNLFNRGIETGDTEYVRTFRTNRQRGGRGLIRAANAFNEQYWLEGARYDANNLSGLEAGISNFLAYTETELPQYARVTQLATSDQRYAAVIQAVGDVNITTQNNFDNSVVRNDYHYVSSGARTDTGASGSDFSTRVSLDAQLPPDLAQQQINPLSLPGFSLPSGEHGLFRLSDLAATDTAAKQADAAPHSWTIGSASIDAAQRTQTADTSEGRTVQVEGQVASHQAMDGHVPGSINRVQGLPETQSTSPAHKYLIETNPALTNLKQFLSSDYLLAGLGYNPDESAKRLGDGFYEQKLIQQALVARTGQRFIDGQHSDEALFKYLMNNAIASKQQLGLSVGTTLTSAQVAALTHDIVWLEEYKVNGQNVLVPVLYLAQANNRLGPDGALIAGRDVNLVSGNDLTNAGTLKAGNNLSANAGNNLVNSGLVQAGGRLDLLTGNTLVNKAGGVITGRDVSLTAVNGDVINERTVTSHQSSSGYRSERRDFADTAARIEAANDLSVWAGRDVNDVGGVLQAGQDLTISAGRDVNVTSAQSVNSNLLGTRAGTEAVKQRGSMLTAGRDVSVSAGRDVTSIASQIDAKRNVAMSATENLTLANAADETHSYSNSRKVTAREDHVSQVGSSVSAAGNVALSAGKDLDIIASRVTATDEAYLYAGNDLNVASAQNTDYSYYSKTKKGSFGKTRSRMTESDRAGVTSSSIQAGSDATLVAARDINVTGSAVVTDKGGLSVLAGNDVNLGAAQSNFYSASAKSKSGGLGLSTTSKIKKDASAETVLVGATLSGNTSTVQAGHDVVVSASNVISTENTNIHARNDIKVESAAEGFSSQHSQSTKKSGLLSTGGIGVTLGTSKNTVTQASDGQTQKGSTIGSVRGDVNMTAGKDMSITASDVVAGNDINLIGRNVSIAQAQNQTNYRQTQENKKSGLTLALSGAVGEAANSTVQNAKAANEEENSRLAALQGVKAALNGYQAYQGAQALESGAQPGSMFGVSLSLGTQKSSAKQVQQQSISQGSSATAGNNLNVIATGSTDGSGGDITVVGSKLKAVGDMLLAANQDIHLAAGANTQKLEGSNSSSGGAVGVSVGVGANGAGLSVFANGNSSAGKERGNGTSWTETTLDAGNKLTLKSGRDTLLEGAQANARQVVADIGRDLTMSSLQDTDKYDSKQTSISGGASFTFGSMTGGGSVNFSKSKLNSDFSSVQEQTGLFAGKGGYQVSVANHSQLNGAVIGSTATADKNSMSTGTLGWTHLRNEAEYAATHQSVNASTGGNPASIFTNNTGNVLLVGANNDGSDHSTTSAAVSNGTLVVRDTAAQQQDVSTLSRDVEHANHALSPIFDKEKERNRLRQAQLIGEIGNQTMDIVRTQGEIVATREAQEHLSTEQKAMPGADPNASYKDRQEYIEVLQSTGAYKDAMAAYGTGSSLQQAVQAVTAAVQGLAGGDIGQAITGASAPYLAKQIKDITGPDTSANLMAHAVLGAVLAKSQGNEALAGAAGASIGELIAKQLYPDKQPKDLTETEKQTVSALSTLAGGLAAGLLAGDAAGAVAGGSAAQNAVNNNHLSTVDTVALGQLEQKYKASCADSGVAGCQKLATQINALRAKGDSILKREAEAVAADFGHDVDYVTQPGDLKPCANAPSGQCRVTDKTVVTAQGEEWVLEPLNDEQAVVARAQAAVQAANLKTQLKEISEELYTTGCGSFGAAAFGCQTATAAGMSSPITGLQASTEDRVLAGAQAILGAIGLGAGLYSSWKGVEGAQGVASKNVNATGALTDAEAGALVERGVGPKGISITIEPKIADQMGKRGWTESSIQSVIDKPVKTVVTKDTRFDTVSGGRLNDPATGYIAKDGSYVVRNDRTGAIVQVSNKKDPEWVAPWD